MIVDPGAWTSMLGSNLARSLVRACIAAGHKPQQHKLQNPVKIAGVGNGSNDIRYDFEGPVAIPTEDGHAKLFNLRAGIVEAPGDDLPGLLGIDVLGSRRAIMDMGKKRLIFPGEGEVEIILPPGSVVTPLTVAPSGHMCITIDDYDDVPQVQGGIEASIPPLRLQKDLASRSGVNGSVTAAAAYGGGAGPSR